MKLSISKTNLMKVLSTNIGIIDKKNTSPILNYCYFECQIGNKIISKATDMDVSLEGEFACDEVEEEGTILLHCKDLFEIARNLPDNEKITITKQENYQILLECGDNIVFKMKGLNPEQYPTFPVYTTEFFSIPSKTLKTMIDKTIYAVSTDSTKYNLNGVYFEKRAVEGKKTIRLVATDAHRLALIDREIEGWENVSINENSGVIVQRKGLVELRKILDDVNDNVKIGFSNNMMIVEIEKYHMMIRLVDGSFPDYEIVIPKNNDKTIVINKKLLHDAIYRAAILPSFSSTMSKIKVVQVRFTENLATIYAYHPEKGEAKETLPIEYSKEDLSASFNSKYCLDVLGICESENIWINLSDSLTAAIFYDEAVSNCIHVIMPMRI